jgi:regulator of protease activity HflC (stomatin/prohibitin superfamily)
VAVGLVVLVVVLFLVVLFLISAINVAREYERGIVFRLGRLFPEPKGPGLFILIQSEDPESLLPPRSRNVLIRSIGAGKMIVDAFGPPPISRSVWR